MALNASRAWVIAYDIADPRRLGRVHRYLKKYAVPVQYSVFVLHDTPARVGRLRGELEALIDPRYDDVRIYPVPDNPQLDLVGQRALPEGVMLIRKGIMTPLTQNISDNHP